MKYTEAQETDSSETDDEDDDSENPEKVLILRRQR